MPAPIRRLAVAGGLVVLVTAAAGCSSTAAPAPTPTPTPSTSSSAVVAAPSPSHTKRRVHRVHHRRPSAAPSTSAVPTTPKPAPRTTAASRPPAQAPLVVIDPGHSVSVHGTDPATGLDVSDYENEPEMRDMWAVAQLVRARLLAAGYRVLLTRSSLDTPSTLGQRAYVANGAHAALALSLHDQAGSNGGIPFDSGNNHVYYQAVGDYRTNPAGHRVYFTDAQLAAVSKRYGQIFVNQRTRAQGTPVNLMSNTGYDLGGRGLQGGDIWIVQLLSHVPWIYNEAGGNSAGMSGLDLHDKQVYANGLAASVEACLPLHR
ncbi:MAG TPA: N-acetylmuramoyl-L-alanine amidase [Jatrophihabitans sp.]